ncbi:MAG: Na+-transporting NADH:ubiquinone oxidoreductase subunit NqrB [Cryomorphaceae bacterium]|jgi:Na+-transporting NADH:ubiquinone oxidoreductase subunit NqrB
MNLVSSISQERNDPRYLQLFLLGSFLTYGLLFLQWSARLDVFAAAFASSIATQVVWAKWKGQPLSSVKSSLISALGLCLLLRVDSVWVMALAGVATISSKFIIRYKGKHVFNPTNFGIILAILTGHAWISPGQWGHGETGILLILLGATGILLRVKRWDLSLTFLLVLFGLESLRLIAYLAWDWPVVFHRFNSGTILLFAFFMITDPKTTPNSRKGRILWAGMIALLSFLLGQFFYLYQAPLIALFIISFTTPLIDKVFRAERFKWIPKTQNI